MNGFKRITTACLFAFGLICSTSSFGNSEYGQWSEAYNDLGIHPTPAEIRAKCKALGMDATQTANLIALEEGAEAAESISAANNLRETYLNLANSALESSSKTTVKMAEKALALLDEVNEEKQSRNVKKFQITDKKLQKLMLILPKRIDSESDIEAIRKVIAKMNSVNAPLKEERGAFIKEVDSYFDTSKSENFDTEAYTQDLVARFNNYVGRLNSR